MYALDPTLNGQSKEFILILFQMQSLCISSEAEGKFYLRKAFYRLHRCLNLKALILDEEFTVQIHCTNI